ncbi:MAG: hypothetical protein IAE77_26090 [Prosthecobacter sp.]|jgi:hypothetical protein|uniref:hypothetical protein n=1 Tax=Prosthecobacter sp. TaxID=1965333 RepID=UPI0019F3D5E0|nr:hypothetical protein [Prosthecobacter sp.]MBE2286953.1 hypothetical protein [Prosthecobacter sp.]
MPRRAQSGVRPAHWLGLLAILAVIGGGGFALMNRATDPMTGVTELSTNEFLENATALSGNIYKIEGIVDDRLDKWRSADGRLFSVQISDGSGTGTFVPVWVPPDYQGANIQRGQRYALKVRVQENGVLEVLELLKV